MSAEVRITETDKGWEVLVLDAKRTLVIVSDGHVNVDLEQSPTLAVSLQDLPPKEG